MLDGSEPLFIKSDKCHYALYLFLPTFFSENVFYDQEIIMSIAMTSPGIPLF